MTRERKLLLWRASSKDMCRTNTKCELELGPKAPFNCREYWVKNWFPKKSEVRWNKRKYCKIYFPVCVLFTRSYWKIRHPFFWQILVLQEIYYLSLRFVVFAGCRWLQKSILLRGENGEAGQITAATLISVGGWLWSERRVS